MKIQLCFQVKDYPHNEMVVEKLKAIKNAYPTDTFVSCHLTKGICEKQGLDTFISDSLVEIFGEKYQSLVTAEDFNQAIAEMELYRTKASEISDRAIFILEPSFHGLLSEIKKYNSNIDFF